MQSLFQFQLKVSLYGILQKEISTSMLTSGCKLTRNTQSPFSWKHAGQLPESQCEFYTSYHIHQLRNSFLWQTDNRNRLVSYQGVKEFTSAWTMNVELWRWQDALRAASFTPSANGATEYTAYFPALSPGAQFVSQHSQARKFYFSVLNQRHYRCSKLLNTSSCFI